MLTNAEPVAERSGPPVEQGRMPRRGTHGRKPLRKGPPYTHEQLIDLSFRLDGLGLGLGKLLTEMSLQDWADRINRFWLNKRQAVTTGLLLTIARRVVPHGQFGRLFKTHPQAVVRPLLMCDRTAERLIRLARHPWVANPTHGSILPSSWRTQAELAHIHPTVLEVLLANGRLHPKLTRAEVSYWRAWIRARTRSRGPAEGVVRESVRTGDRELA